MFKEVISCHIFILFYKVINIFFKGMVGDFGNASDNIIIL